MKILSTICLIISLCACGNPPDKVFYVTAGATFKIELQTNGSTGYSNCWMNKSRCPHLELSDRLYKSSWREKYFHEVGANSSEILTFKAISPGIDTVFFSCCPTARSGKICDQFLEDTCNCHWDERFIVKIN
jgi:hypothetical protein